MNRWYLTLAKKKRIVAGSVVRIQITKRKNIPQKWNVSLQQSACIVSMRCMRNIIIQIFWKAFNQNTQIVRDDFRMVFSFAFRFIVVFCLNMCIRYCIVSVNTKHGDHSIYRWRVRCFNVCWHDVLISNSYTQVIFRLALY